MLDIYEDSFIALLVERGLKVAVIVAISLAAWYGLRYGMLHLSKTLKKIDDKDDSEFDQRIHTVIRFIRSIGYTVIIVTMGTTILSTLNIDILPILASAGVAGIAIGFGAQTLVKDMLGGFFIIVENQYTVGDDIIVGDVEGIVSRLNFRTTHIRDDDGILHTIPNGEIRIVANQSKRWSNARVDFIVPYEENIAHVKLVLRKGLDILREEQGEELLMLEPFEISGPESIDERGVCLRVLAKVEPGHQGRLQRVLREYLLELFRENHIKFSIQRREVVMLEPKVDDHLTNK